MIGRMPKNSAKRVWALPTLRNSGKRSMTQSLSVRPSFQGVCPIKETVERLASEGGIEERGAINTKREVADFILDLVGYTADQPLTDFRLLEPSIGNGDFILSAVKRLLSAAQCEPDGPTFAKLAPAIRGVEIHLETIGQNRQAMYGMMIEWGISPEDTEALLDTWLTQGDFLLCDFDQDFTHAVGNPPYVRHDVIPDVLMAEYRQRYSTIYDRADIYVPFIEKSLRALGTGGKLGFICADRWMKNRYGKKLREFVSKAYHLTTYVDMVGTDAFHSEVSAYPAITVIKRCAPEHGKRGKSVTRFFARPEINGKTLGRLARELTMPKLMPSTDVREIDRIVAGGEPWIFEDFDALALIRRLEASLPTIEEAGCKVGIGVATGADKAFIGDFEELDIEPSRKLPLVMARDILEGHVQWRGKGVINPLGDDGRLVSLARFPKLRRYLEERYEQIAARHIATKAPQNWYRTIDRIYPELVRREKLLVPDIKGDASIVYEGGKFYPHHNLYFITSNEWDVHALQAVMRSGIARFFVSLYSTKMRGGYLRFQAQYLRRIRLPRWENVSEKVRKRLKHLSEASDRHELDEIVAGLYGLSVNEMNLIKGDRAG